MATSKKNIPTKTLSKKVSKQAAPEAVESDRTRKLPKYKSFRLSKKIPHPAGPLPSIRILIRKTLKLISSNYKPLFGILIVFIVLNLVLVRGFASPTSVSSIKDSLTQLFGTETTGITLVGTVFSEFLSPTDGSVSSTASVYRTLLFVIVSLTLIWVYRQSAAGKKVSTKNAFYGGMYPLIPFLLVFLVLILQLLPGYIGVFIYNTVSSGGIAASVAEKGLWISLMATLILLSVYMVSSSLFALYIVTLQDMSPMQALRSSRLLVFSRRLSVFRKLLIIPLVALLALILIVVPAIYFLPWLASWLYFTLSLASIIFLHAYLFTLYKELL